MSKVPYYKVSTTPKRFRKTPEKSNFLGGKRRRQLILAVLGVYLVASGLLGFFIFNSRNRDKAEASAPAGITSSLRFNEEKEFKIGDTVDVVLTLQNSSVIDSINEINLDVLSTKDSVKWTKAINKSTNQELTPIQKGAFILPSLTFGERAEYQITGIYQESSLDFLTILAKIRYRNNLGPQNIDSNRIYTNLNPEKSNDRRPLSLASDKEVYQVGEKVTLTLNSANPETELKKDLRGKIYINNRDTNQTISTQDCIASEAVKCEFSTAELGVGPYSAIFIDEKGEKYSTIVWFSVSGKTVKNSLVPNTTASLNFPLGSGTVNGLLPVTAQRVISQNQSPDSSANCVFEVTDGTNTVLEVPAPILNDRSCKAEIATSQLPNPGIYKVKLANTGLIQDISFVAKASGLLTLNNLSPNSQKAQSVQVETTNIVNSTNTAVTDDPLTLYVFNKNTGELTSLTTINGDRLQILNGTFKTTIPSSVFSSSGTYLIYFISVGGLASDFLTLNLSDSNLGFSSTGVMISDYSKLKVGESFELQLQGISDKDGNKVTSGTCNGSIYTSESSILAIAIDGQIVDGNCKVIVPEGKITKSGPALISFNSGNQQNSLSQAKQIQISPGIPENYGKIALEYEPALLNFANNAIIGPVTDVFGNPTNSFGNILSVSTASGELLKEIAGVNIIDGYAKVSIPSSLLSSEKVVLKLLNAEAKELIAKEINIVQSGDLLSLPDIPNTIKNNQPISLSVRYNDSETIENCVARFYRNNKDFIEEKTPYNFDKQICSFEWNLNQFRNVNRGLIEITAGKNQYSKIVTLESVEAANLFTVHPGLKFNKQKELEISLVTTPIVDIHGLPIKSGEMRWQYNGKIEKTPIIDGFATLDITATKLETRDIQTKLDQRFLDLDLDVQASPTSISQTNNVSIYLGDYDISSQRETLQIKSGSNYVSANSPKIFKFNTDSCSAFVIASNFTATPAKTHKQGNECYVQVSGTNGKNHLQFENNGHYEGKFDFTSDTTDQDVDWCVSENDKCNLIQVLAPTSSNVEAIIYDGENQFKFSGADLENLVNIKQNGLNPLKEYLVEVKYLDINGRSISHFNTVLGEKLAE